MHKTVTDGAQRNAFNLAVTFFLISLASWNPLLWGRFSLFGNRTKSPISQGQVNDVGGCSPTRHNLPRSIPWGQKELIRETLWNKLHTELPLSQIFTTNLSHHVPVNVQLILPSILGFMVYGHQFMNWRNYSQTNSSWWPCPPPPRPETNLIFTCYCMTTKKNPSYMLGSYR